LCIAFNNLYKQGGEYKSIAEMLPFNSGMALGYLYFKNETNGDVLESKPLEASSEIVKNKSQNWSQSGLYDIFNYYRVAQVEPEIGNKLVFTCKIGEIEAESKKLLFYEQTDKNIVVELDGKPYKPVIGSIQFEDIESWLYNGTELGLKK
jgi:hypothetical protein